MMLIDSLDRLRRYCEEESFKGWDPYDGLNSKVFNSTFLKNWGLTRLIWIQLFKRSPINLRTIFLVPKDYNAKGIALLLTGYCNLYKYSQSTRETTFGTEDQLKEKIRLLSDLLIDLQTDGFSGSCWGYNFGWQARRLFYFTKGTPTVVATTFCATALMDAFEITQDEKYLQTALSSADFVLKDLSRTYKNDGFLFSYAPFKGNNTVYNASLLGSNLLSRCYYYNQSSNLLDEARNSIIACVNAQNEDGSWFYGELPVQKWIDSFHTGYNLVSIKTYQQISNDHSFDKAIEKGFDFYINNFFTAEGIPKYYHNRIFPIDIHSPAQLFATLNRLQKCDSFSFLSDSVMNWTVRNMQDEKGYFYYQLRKGFSSKISYMRWSNAFIFYGMSYHILDKCNS